MNATKETWVVIARGSEDAFQIVSEELGSEVEGLDWAFENVRDDGLEVEVVTLAQAVEEYGCEE